MIEVVRDTSTLSSRLRERIQRTGPITFCEWMRSALYDEHAGYYRRADRQKWGRGGDYRTSPERSELFSATFARYFASLHDKLGAPSEWTIVESGAGDGSFAHGVLGTLEQFFPHVFLATHYVVDDVGQNLGARARLEIFPDRVEFRPVTEVSINPGIIFSNELLDAFPVHRVTVEKGQIQEYYVDLGPDGKFVWQLGPPSSDRLTHFFESRQILMNEGYVAEVNLAIEDWLKPVGDKLTRGYLINVDYGADAQELYASPERRNGSLRSFKDHRFVDDVLLDPGGQDLTTTIDWSFVRDVGEKAGLRTVDFKRLDKFLLAAGLLSQLEVQSESASDDAERLRLSTAAREMILPDGMAASFQVLVQEKVV